LTPEPVAQVLATKRREETTHFFSGFRLSSHDPAVQLSPEVAKI
jgi:hypothetical protein